MLYFHGFTLLETLIAIALTSIIGTAALTTGGDAYEHGLAHTDQLLVLSALREARAEAMNTICTSQHCVGPTAHGVLLLQKKLILFEGPSVSERIVTTDQTIYFSGKINLSANGSFAVIFAPETGDVSSSTTFSIQNGRVQEIVTINSQGRISSFIDNRISS